MKRLLSFVLLSFMILSGVVPSEATDKSAVAVNYSTSTLCQEEDNVNVALSGAVKSFIIEATHPTYDILADSCATDFTDCIPTIAPEYTFNAGTYKLFDDGVTVVEAIREATWWRPQGMSFSVDNGASESDIHYIRLNRKIADANEWPQFLVLYSDGNSRLIPHPPAGKSSICFGSSVIVGQASPAGRPIAEIASAQYDSSTGSIDVSYVDGSAATLKILGVDRTSARVRVTATKTTTDQPFATFRSMYVEKGKSDVDSLRWTDTDGVSHEATIMDFTTGEGPASTFYRGTYSQHNTSAPDITIRIDTQAVNDYSGDGKTDLAVYHQAAGDWYIAYSSGGYLLDYNMGWSEAVPAPGDYDGDGMTDMAVYHQAAGNWYIAYSSGGYLLGYNMGWNEAVPVPGDYDGDGKTDLAVYHQAAGNWYIAYSGGGYLLGYNMGWNEAVPVPGDYDGDGKTDLAVYHQVAGNWYIAYSGGGYLLGYNMGWNEAVPVPGDYDGDGMTDMAVYHRAAGDWYIAYSSGGYLLDFNMGWSEAVPVPGDYDGDGKTDMAVYHQAAGDWYITYSSGGYLLDFNMGWSEAAPVGGY